MSRNKSPSIASSVAASKTAAFCNSTLLLFLLSTCSFHQQGEGFAPPLISHPSSNSNDHRPAGARPTASLATGSCSGTCLLARREQQRGWAPPLGRAIAAEAIFHVALSAASAATEFEDPLGGGGHASAMLDGAEEGMPPKTKRKASPRKKMTPEEKESAALKRKQIRDNMTPEEKAAKKEAAALKRKEKLASMTPEEKAAKKAAADRRKAMKPKLTEAEVAAKKEALALRKMEKKEQEQREWDEREAQRRYKRLAGASLTMEDVEAAARGDGGDGGVIVSDSKPEGVRISVHDDDDDDDEFEGWEFVEDGEEDDESEEIPYWQGQAPEFNEDGKMVGVDSGGVRVATAALAVKDETIGVKVPNDDDFHWYLLRCFATYEMRCRNAVEARLHGAGMDDRVKEIWVPSRQVPKQVGKKVTFKEEPIYQGYVYCNVKMNKELRDMVNDMERIVGFVGETRDEDKRLIPEKMAPEDIEGIRESERALGSNKVPKLLGVGDLVEISEGPFAMKKGEVSKIRDGEYVVKVNTFGRNSDVKVAWDGVRQLTELEVETWFEETRRAMDAAYMERDKRGKRPRRRRGGGGFVYDDQSGFEPKPAPSATADGGSRARWGGGLDHDEDPQAAERRRFMEKDMEMWEAESTSPEATRVRRPSGDKVDEQLPEEAFESTSDEDDFFESLESILGGGAKKGPALPGARAQGPSVVERAHAVAELKRQKEPRAAEAVDDDFDLFDFSGNGSNRRAVNSAPRGSTGSAGLLEPGQGITRVSRDAPAPRQPNDDDDDDLFSSLMKELKELPPDSLAPEAAAAPSPETPPRGGREGGSGAGGGVDVRPRARVAPEGAVASAGAEAGPGPGAAMATGAAAADSDPVLEDLLIDLAKISPPPPPPPRPSPAADSRRTIGSSGSSGNLPKGVKRGRAGEEGDGFADFEELLAGLEAGAGLNAAAGSSISSSSPGSFDEIDELFADIEKQSAFPRTNFLEASYESGDAPPGRPMPLNGGGGGGRGGGRGRGAGAAFAAAGTRAPPRGRGEAMARGVQAGEDIINELLANGGPRAGFGPPNGQQQISRSVPKTGLQTGPRNGPRTGPRIVSPAERRQFQEQQARDRASRQQYQQGQGRSPPPPPPPPLSQQKMPPRQQGQSPQRQSPQEQFQQVPPARAAAAAAVPPVAARTPPLRASTPPASRLSGGGGDGGGQKRKSESILSDLDLLPPVPGGVTGGGLARGGSEPFGTRERQFEGEVRQPGRTRTQQPRSPPPPLGKTTVADVAPPPAAELDFSDVDAILGDDFASEAAAAASEGSEGGDDIGDAPPAAGVVSGSSGSVRSDGGGGGGSLGASRAEVEGMKLPELKQRCKALGLKVGGKKAELQARIIEALQ